jgi:S-DNA-T family DNA segregation ATPase FtsK/SpoIIIE
MDEFQVLFSEEDRLAREAGRLLADIAKRGAAFGLHLLLATQSPGGPLAAYLRPVYEQMALRIALGCTQPSVSQAILGEGNDAATKLVRAGDAIYNDRRGEGANPVMRIAVLPTRERLKLIEAIRSLAPGRDYPPPASFDPGTPADFAPMEPTGASGRTVQAWLGEAIEIKPATTATFERYVRSNLLIVGGEEHGHGLLLATLLSAAVQRSPADVRFTVAEFTRPSSSFHGFFASAERLPHEVRIADRKTAGAALDDLLAELDTRLAEPDKPDGLGGPDGPDGPPQPEVFFLIAGMHRWHELVTEGDYGRPSETSACLVRLAEAGPDVGIHVVA